MTNAKRWQTILSSIIFIAAALILLPQLLGFAAGLGRMAILIVLIISVALGISYLRVKYLSKRLKRAQNKIEPTSDNKNGNTR